MKKIVSFLIIFLLFTSCSKNKAITIEGILMEDCNTPAANVECFIYEHDFSHALLSNDVWIDFTTKENIDLQLNLKNFDRVLSEIEVGNSNLNLGNVYYNNLGGTPLSYKYYPGPFSSGILDTVDHYIFKSFPIKFIDIYNHGAPEVTFSYRVRSLPYFNNHNFTKFHLNTTCSDEYAEATFVIE